MTKYMPYQNTTISATKSASDVADLLELLGFDTIAQVTHQGKKMVVATFKGAEFRFKVDAAEITKALHSSGRKSQQDIEEQANRVAWRMLWYQVKCSCDILKYQTASVAQVFGGFLEFRNRAGDFIGLAEYITTEVEAGRVPGSRLRQQLLLTKGEGDG